MARLLGIGLALAYAALLALVAFYPTPVELLFGIHVPPEHLHLWETVANVGLFVPFGWTGTSLTGRVGWVIIAGVIVSVCIELAQLVLSPMRVAEVSDVLKNGLGTAIGCGLAVALGTRPSRVRTNESDERIS